MSSNITDISRFVAFLKSFGIDYVEETVAGSIFVKILSPFRDSVPYYYFFNGDGEYTGIHYSHAEEKTATFFLRRTDSDGHNLYHCDSCHKEFDSSGAENYKFCPLCGVKFTGMREVRNHDEPRWQYDLRMAGYDVVENVTSTPEEMYCWSLVKEFTFADSNGNAVIECKHFVHTWEPTMTPAQFENMKFYLKDYKREPHFVKKFYFALHRQSSTKYDMSYKLVKRPVT